MIEIAFGHFMAARVLQVAAQLDLFTHLAQNALSAGELATRLSVDEHGLEALLVACAALNLIEKQGEQYRTPDAATNLLAAGRPGSVAHVLAGAAGIYRDWVDLEQVIRTGKAMAPPTRSKGLEEMRAFVLEMHRSSQPAAQFLASALDLRGATRLVDVGGGAGTFAIALCRRYGKLQATVFDLPEVVSVAGEVVQQSGLADRIRIQSGDYHRDRIPSGHDVALLCNVLHQENEENARQLVRNCYSALRPTGTLFVWEAVLNDNKTGPLAVALGALNQLLHHQGGNYRPAAELAGWLAHAGFGHIQRMSTPFPDIVLLVAAKR